MDRNKELTDLVTLELSNLERLAGEIAGLLTKEEDEITSYEVRAAGSILHDFYCGVEKLFERIALSLDGEMPDGMNWHNELLLQMGKPIEGIRDRVISEELINKLKEFLRFRHLFRHIYGFELKWERIKSLCMELEQVTRNLKDEINDFFSIDNDD